MAFKIKDNLDLYGNQLLNFALQSDSGFPQSPQVGHMFNYTGAGVMANHAVMCVDETTKAFKALAFVDEIATNAEFVELKEKVDLLIGDDVDMDGIIESWKEVEAFLAGMKDTENLMDLLNSKADKTQLANYLPLSGGTITASSYPLTLSAQQGGFLKLSVNGVDYANLGSDDGLGTWLSDKSGNYIHLRSDGLLLNNTHKFLHSGNIEEYALFERHAQVLTSKDNLNDFKSGYYGWSNADTPINGIGNNTAMLAMQGAREHSDSFQLVFDYNTEGMFYRCRIDANSWKPWKTIAFTDSDITGNAATASSVMINYTTSDEQYEILFTNPQSESVAKNDAVYRDNDTKFAYNPYHNILYVGRITSPGIAVDWNDTWNDGTNSNPWHGLKVNSVNSIYDVVLTGYHGVTLKAASGNITLTSSGNVLIGTTDDSGDKLQVAGSGSFYGVRYEPRTFVPSTTGWYRVYKSLIYSRGDNVRLYISRNYNDFPSGSYTFDITIGYQKANITQVGSAIHSSYKYLSNVRVIFDDNYAYIDVYISGNSNSWYVSGSGRGEFQSGVINTETANVFATLSPVDNSMVVGGNLIVSGAVTMSSTLSVDGNTRIKGDLIVDGNIIGKKEVSAGGAGQEGESGDGGAEVLAQQLAKGQSTYSITNTIGRSDIAVSLYEWNANNSSWDMCLADISVKDATITVTFGSATSVNHKLVAVG